MSPTDLEMIGKRNPLEFNGATVRLWRFCFLGVSEFRDNGNSLDFVKCHPQLIARP